MFRWVKGCLPPLPRFPFPSSSLSGFGFGFGFGLHEFPLRNANKRQLLGRVAVSWLGSPLFLLSSHLRTSLPPSLAHSTPHSALPHCQLLPMPQFCSSLHSLPALDMPQHTYVAPLSSASFTPLYSTLLLSLSFASFPSPFLSPVYCFSHAIQQCNCQGFSGFFSRCFLTQLSLLPSSAFLSPPWAAPHHHSHALASKGS